MERFDIITVDKARLRVVITSGKIVEGISPFSLDG